MAPTALSLSLSLSLSLPLSLSLSVQTHAHTHNVRGPPLLTGSHMLGTTDRALNGLSSTCARAREEGGGGSYIILVCLRIGAPLLMLWGEMK